MAKRSIDDNKLKILQLLNTHGAISRVDIASMLGFTKSAITIVTNEMIRDKLIYEKNIVADKFQKSMRGRKKILLNINENHKLVLGIVLEEDRLTVGVTNLSGQTVAVTSAEIRETEISVICAKAYEIANNILSLNWIESENILGIGACVTLDAIKHFGENDEDIESCCETFKKALHRYFEQPITTSHFTYAMALAQKTYKTLIDEYVDTYVLVRHSHSVESKLVIDGQIVDKSGKNLNWFCELYDFSDLENVEKVKTAIFTIKTIINPKKIFISTDINNSIAKKLFSDECVEIFTKNFEEKYYENLLVPKDSIKTSVHVFASALAVSDFFYKYGD